jgi:hypothetical protein
VTTYTSAEEFGILLQLGIVLLIIRRSYSMSRGVPYSLPRLLVLPALILVLWALSELESTLLTPWAVPYLIALDLAILVATLLGIAGVAERMTEVHRGPSGLWSYRIGFSLAALYLAAFLVRVIVSALWFPSSLEFTRPSGGFPPASQQLVLALIDTLYSVSAGLLAGRTLGIYRRVRAASTGPESGSAARS